MALVSINIDQEFMDDSFSNSEDVIRRPILPKNYNIKHGMTQYKIKLDEKRRKEKIIKMKEKNEDEKFNIPHSPKRWRSDTSNTEEKFFFSEETKLNHGNYVINVQNMKLPPGAEGSNSKNLPVKPLNQMNNDSYKIGKINSIKGNLFRNTSKSLKFKAMEDPFAKYESKKFKINLCNFKKFSQENILGNVKNFNSDLNLEDNYISPLNINESNKIHEIKEIPNNEKSSNENNNDNNEIEDNASVKDQEIDEEKIKNASKTVNNFYVKNPMKESINKENHVQNSGQSPQPRENIMSAKNPYNPKSLVEFTYHPNRTSSTIYNVLNKRKKEFFENIKTQNKKNSTLEPTKELLYQKKNFLKTNNITSLLEKKKKDFIPYVFPVAWIHTNNFGNNSEKNRFEKITDLFLKLRVYINENPDNELIITKEFFIKHGIYDTEFFSFEHLSNFIFFIKSDDCLKINPSKSLKDIIIDATNERTYNDNVFTEGNNSNINLSKNQINCNNKEREINNLISENNQEDNSSSNLNNYGNNSTNPYNNAYNNSVSVNQNFSNNPNTANYSVSNKTNHKNNINKTNMNLYEHKQMLGKTLQNFSNNSKEEVQNLNYNKNYNYESIKPLTSQCLKGIRNKQIQSMNEKIQSLYSDDRTNPNLHPILNEKIYKIEYSNPKAVIDNLEPEILKIKGLSINKSQPKIEIKNYTKAINNSKKNQKFLAKEVSTSGQLPLKDIEQIKKKNKLLEYIVLQRSKNRLKLENDKKIFELDYNTNERKNQLQKVEFRKGYN